MHLVGRKSCCVDRSLVTLQLPQERLLLRIKYLHSLIASSGAAASRHKVCCQSPQHPTVVRLAVEESSDGMAKWI